MSNRGRRWTTIEDPHEDGHRTEVLTVTLELVEDESEKPRSGFGQKIVEVVSYEQEIEVNQIWRFDYPDSSSGNPVTRMVRVTAIYDGGDFGGIDLVRGGGYRRFKTDRCIDPEFQMVAED